MTRPHDRISGWKCFGAVLAGLALATGACADEAADKAAQEAELVKKTLNPVASLISVPFQNNWDFGIGKKDGMKYTVNIQPVIPISIAKDWNVIVRTIMPVIYQEEIIPDINNSVAPPKVDFNTSQSGLGDITQSFFFSPKDPVGGWILGAGPSFCIRAPPTTAWAASNGARGQRPSSCSKSMAGPMACWPTTSGHSPATTTGQA